MELLLLKELQNIFSFLLFFGQFPFIFNATENNLHSNRGSISFTITVQLGLLFLTCYIKYVYLSELIRTVFENNVYRIAYIIKTSSLLICYVIISVLTIKNCNVEIRILNDLNTMPLPRKTRKQLIRNYTYCLTAILIVFIYDSITIYLWINSSNTDNFGIIFYCIFEDFVRTLITISSVYIRFIVQLMISVLDSSKISVKFIKLPVACDKIESLKNIVNNTIANRMLIIFLTDHVSVVLTVYTIFSNSEVSYMNFYFKFVIIGPMLCKVFLVVQTMEAFSVQVIDITWPKLI